MLFGEKDIEAPWGFWTTTGTSSVSTEQGEPCQCCVEEIPAAGDLRTSVSLKLAGNWQDAVSFRGHPLPGGLFKENRYQLVTTQGTAWGPRQ